jgi:CRISPR-associated protein Csx3
MTTYKIELQGEVLKIGFGEAAQNDQIVREAAARLAEISNSGELSGGRLIKINGPASVPVACVLVHQVSHLYGAVGVFDPKLGKYVIAISHNSTYNLGDLVD